VKTQTACPSVERLRELLNYDPETGAITWKVWRGRNAKAGHLAGAINAKGYRLLSVDGVLYYSHRVAWAIHYGKWPPAALQVNHKDHDRANNRIGNLELATSAQNTCHRRGAQANNKCGFRGVDFVPSRGKWRATITLGGKVIHLGSFLTVQEAISARIAGAHLHGNFRGNISHNQPIPEPEPPRWPEIQGDLFPGI